MSVCVVLSSRSYPSVSVHRVLTRYLCQSCRSVVTLGTENGITKVHAATGASEQRRREASRLRSVSTSIAAVHDVHCVHFVH
jgi:hypothetical protein